MLEALDVAVAQTWPPLYVVGLAAGLLGLAGLPLFLRRDRRRRNGRG